MAITLTKEDGTGLANANVYADLADADQYLENTARKSAWRAFSSRDRQAALIQGTDYLDQVFRRRYKGTRFSSAQRLEWPRSNVYDELGVLVDAADIPEEVLNAAIEYAFEAAGGALAPTPEVDDTGGTVIRKKEKVDVLEEETQYSDRQDPKRFRAYPRAELVIRRWLKTGSGRLYLRAG